MALRTRAPQRFGDRFVARFVNGIHVVLDKATLRHVSTARLGRIVAEQAAEFNSGKRRLNTTGGRGGQPGRS